MTKVRLGDSVQIKHGFAFPGSYFGENAALPQVLTPGNFAQGERFKESVKSFSGEVPTGYRLKAGDVVVTMTDLSKSADTLGLSAILPDGPEYLHNQRIGLVRFRPGSRVTPTYFHYLTRSPAYRSYVVGTATGTTVRHTSPDRIEALELEVPDLQTQEAVGDVASALDDKIVANRKLESSLWQMVDAQAKLAASVEPRATVLGDLIRLNYGRALPVARRRGGEVAVMGSGGEVGRHDEALVSGPSVIVGRKGSVGATYWVDGPAYPIDTTYWVEPVGVPLLFVYTVLKNIDFTGMSTDSAVPGLNRDRAYAIPVALPSPEELRTFELCTASLVERAAAADEENLRLAATRDELLPLLMSGKITVKNAEKTVEEVV